MISFLGSEVGRGHPFYLDGVLAALEAKGRGDLIAHRTDVFEVSRGLSKLAWQSVRASYRIAGRGGSAAALYHWARGQVDYEKESSLLTILGRDLRRWARGVRMIVVDHPSIVGALGGRDDVWYIHGEMIAPDESILVSAARTFVPLAGTADEFVRGGVLPERMLVTGICVEVGLVEGATRRMEERRGRIASGEPLTIAFFSSGAEPVRHVEALAAGAKSVVSSGHRAVVFAQRGGRLGRLAGGVTASGLEIVEFSERAELDRLTASRFGSFDAVVSPPHERSNWAVSLGIPFFLVGPDIGPFAPRNRSRLLQAGVAAEIPSVAAAQKLAGTLAELRDDGRLARMAESGVGHSIRGFERIAGYLIEECERRSRAVGEIP